jgi:hypothetical protein
MRPAALRIYRKVFPGCDLKDHRTDGVGVHPLDREFGIDSRIEWETGEWLTVQEKYRRHEALRWSDFTQEFMNGAGTKHESPGEWFHLAAQLYFYGWARRDETDFEKWLILNITTYKLLVQGAGGLAAIGTKCQNDRHGRASFFAIKPERLWPALIEHSPNLFALRLGTLNLEPGTGVRHA